MKKFLLILTLAISLPAWSTCPISGGESVCSISNTGSSSMPLFQTQTHTDSNSNKSISMPSTTMQQSGSNYSFGSTQNQDGIQMQGSLGCQFGNCLKNGNNDFVNK